VRLIDQAPRYVRAEIDELDLSKIRTGAKARITVLTTQRAPFTATVRKVVPFISTIREQDRTAEIELAVDSGAVLLPVGASADVEIILTQKTNVLIVPSRAVLGRKDSRYVFKYVDGKAKKTSVELGITGYDNTEILSGLSENDTVVIPSDDLDVLDGSSVTIKKSA